MIGFTEWASTTRFPDKPWLVLGKGPTFSRRGEFDLAAYNLLSLNHVVNEVDVDIAHMMDIDVVEACAERLLDGCTWLLMPRVPHIQSRPSLLQLEHFVAAMPALQELDRQGRLVWYAAETGPTFAGSPVIEVRYFSSEAALSLLAALGATTVRSLGVDGGTSYSGSFRAIDAQTRLANGQPTFDLQFAELQRIVHRHDLDYRPLIEPLRIFVGASEAELVPARVLEHSIRTAASIPVRVTPMINLPVPTPRDRKNRPRTAFSFSRFLIPELCGFEGRGVYLDSDMQVFGDVAELAALPFDGATVLCTTQDEAPQAWVDNRWFHPGRQMSVMVLDAARLGWRIREIVDALDAGRLTYEDLMFRLSIVPEAEIADTVPPEWNHLEHYDAGATKLLHYTVVPTQPWLADGNPLEPTWREGYRAALAAGALQRDEVEAAVQRGAVKRSLLDDLHLIPDPRRMAPASSAAVELAAAHRRIQELQAARWRWKVRALVRRFAPLVRATRARRADGPLARATERLADRARRMLR